MRTKSSVEVKHCQHCERAIHHCSRAVCETFPVPDERDDALEPALADGRYDAFILSAEERDNAIALSCAITTGPHRGDVVDLVSTTLKARDPFALVGLPCTLVVDGHTIHFEK